MGGAALPDQVHDCQAFRRDRRLRQDAQAPRDLFRRLGVDGVAVEVYGAVAP
ncbi:hypothetical protein [Actinomadura soli]|uniref:hypothetical protein n=1 Tax=Actinomadura soli TaxID=2508997 RepID=UPI00197A90D3|nr:hypothetical protein [Actinomadura soli]